jgi:hypothetical protein
MGGFHLRCGTSCVTYVTQDDLPESTHQPSSNFYLLTQGHNIVVDYLKEHKVPTHPIPFPTTFYVTDSGENWSGNFISTLLSKRWLLWKWFSPRPLTSQLRKEFGL